MSEPKFTPGPWKVLHTPTRKETFWAVATHNDAPIQAVIGLVDGVSKAHQENPKLAEGNANLIAAAPDLYEALKEGLGSVSDMGAWMARANAALAKANGSV